MASDLASSFQQTVVDFLSPLEEAARNPQALAEWLATLGQTETISRDPALLEIARHAQVLSGKISAFRSESLKSWTGLAAILASAREVSEIQRELRRFAEDPQRAQVTQGLAQEIIAALFASYLRRRQPTLFRIGCLLTLIDARESSPLQPALIENGRVVRYARVLDRFKFGSIERLFTDPGKTLSAVYFPNDMSSGADAWLAAARLFPNISFLANELGLSWRTEYRPTASRPPSLEPDPEEALLPHGDLVDEGDVAPPPPPPVSDTYFAASHPIFRLRVAGTESSGVTTELALEILSSSRQHEGAIAGFILGTVGEFNFAETRGEWKLTGSASGEIPAVTLGPDGFSRVPGDHPLANGSAKLLIERLPTEGSAGPAFIFGSPEGTHLALGNVQVAGGISYNPERTTASIDVAATSGAFVLAPGDGDGFLSSVLPSQGLQGKFDIGLKWSSEDGLTLRGGGRVGDYDSGWPLHRWRDGSQHSPQPPASRHWIARGGIDQHQSGDRASRRRD
jgi:hypothetical protein